jgi:hypothetical protein
LPEPPGFRSDIPALVCQHRCPWIGGEDSGGVKPIEKDFMLALGWFSDPRVENSQLHVGLPPIRMDRTHITERDSG